MIYSSKNLSIAGLFAFAAFSPNNVEALPQISCETNRYGDSYIYVSVTSQCKAVVAELNKFDGISGMKCVSERVLHALWSSCIITLDQVSLCMCIF